VAKVSLILEVSLR